MPKATGRKFDAWYILMRNMARKEAAILSISIQLLNGEKTAFSQCCIDSNAIVPLAEHDSVSIRPAGVFGVNFCNFSKQYRHDICDG